MNKEIDDLGVPYRFDLRKNRFVPDEMEILARAQYKAIHGLQKKESEMVKDREILDWYNQFDYINTPGGCVVLTPRPILIPLFNFDSERGIWERAPLDDLSSLNRWNDYQVKKLKELGANTK